MASGDTELTQDVVFDILSRARRRYVLYTLKTEGPMELTELAERVAAWENDVDLEDLEKQQRKRVYVSLYQTHVPKLEEAGLVEYDDETSIVSLGSQVGEIDRFLGGEQQSYPWQYLYLTIAVTGLVLVTLSSVGVPFFDALSPTSIAVALIVLVAVTAGLQVALWVRRSDDNLGDLQYE
jgi:hypothetical protein